jgi:hypothetical protein
VDDIRRMAKRRAPIDDLIDAHAWMGRRVPKKTISRPSGERETDQSTTHDSSRPVDLSRVSELDIRLDRSLVWGPQTELIRQQVRFCLRSSKAKKDWTPPPLLSSDFQYVPREAYLKALEPLAQLFAELAVEDKLKQHNS